jgi:hypothetical protein
MTMATERTSFWDDVLGGFTESEDGRSNVLPFRNTANSGPSLRGTDPG